MKAPPEELNLVIVGHVDHGKSTIVGRLLADSGKIPEGKIEAIREFCRRTSRPFEYAFLLDALKEERAQGITIDAARCFFRTAKRRYTLIDAPGHIEFLKNMITGASSAEAALLVIDAAEGVKDNSRRHGYLLSMLGICQIAVLVNKMDLVSYSKDTFDQIVSEYSNYLNEIHFGNDSFKQQPTKGNMSIQFIPVSGMVGDNIAAHSPNMDWYNGPILLEQLESFKAELPADQLALRLPVQDVYKFTRNGDNRRIIAGKIETGRIAVGDKIVFLPSGKKTKVRSLERFNSDPKTEECAGWSIGFTTSEQIFIRRGEIVCKLSEEPLILPHTASHLQANIFWLGKTPLQSGKKYTLKIHTARVIAEVVSIHRVLDAASLNQRASNTVNHNEVAEVNFNLDREIAFDLVNECPPTGRFVIIDEFEISGGGIITGFQENARDRLSGMIQKRNSHWESPTISRAARAERYNQKSCLIMVSSADTNFLRKQVAKKLEARLFADGKFVYFIGMANLIYGLDADLLQNSSGDFKHDPDEIAVEYFRRLAEIANLMLDAGLILVVSARAVRSEDLEVLSTVLWEHRERIYTVWVGDHLATDLIPDIHLSDKQVEQSDHIIKKFLQTKGLIFSA